MFVKLENLVGCEKCGIVLDLSVLRNTKMNQGRADTELECPLCKSAEQFAVDQVLDRFGLNEGLYSFSMKHFRQQPDGENMRRINLIKTLRTYFDCGLKEGKDCTEGSGEVTARITSGDLRLLKQELSSYGLKFYTLKKIKD